MDVARKIGIGIVMIIPTFVGGGALWSIFENWIAVFIWFVIMVVVSGGIVSGRLLSR